MQKRFFFWVLFVGLFMDLAGQSSSYNNEWIDYNKTYYRFRIGATGVYRISAAQLATLGLQNTNAADFQLWRNGEQVALYTSAESGPITADGFLEFWGEKNDGKWERRMYLQPQFQINDRVSVFTDTAAYFLTVNPGGNNKRLVNIANNLAANFPAESYFMYKLEVSFSNLYNQGFAGVVGSNLYSSSFDEGEGFTSGDIRPGSPLITTHSNLFVSNAGPAAKLLFTAAGRSLNTRNIAVRLNGNLLAEKEMHYFKSVTDSSANNIPISQLNSQTASIEFRNTSAVSTDRMVVGMYALTYPRQFNFGGETVFEFELPASAEGKNLVIDQFNAGGVAPVLYDLTNGWRITAAVLSPTQVRIVLPPSSVARKLVLISMQPDRIRSVNGFTTRNFVNYALAANQADYLILSNTRLNRDANGVNQVAAYQQYRSSAAGGNFNAKIFDADEIIDQFGWGIKNNAFGVKNFVRFVHQRFARRPQYLFIIGKGVELSAYRSGQANPQIEQMNLVPVYGNPASDNLMVSEEGKVTPLIPVGRLNAVNGSEVKAYLDKVIAYEKIYQVNPCMPQDALWKKNVIHIAGANDGLGDQIAFHLNQYKQIASDTLMGADVYTLRKTSVAAIQNIATENITRLFNEGFSLLTYFGHSSANLLEFNLDNPRAYPVSEKYPIFIVNGCQAGDLFGGDPSRLNGSYIISEDWVLNPSMGSIAFIASTHYGLVNYLHLITDAFYRQMARSQYAGSVGGIMQKVLDTLSLRHGFNDFFTRMHLEQMTLHGDPAIRFYGFDKPDYVVEAKDVKVAPEFVSIAEPFFSVDVFVTNAGRAVKDSVTLQVTRIFPDGARQSLLNRKLKAIPLRDSIRINVPIDAFRDKGLSRIEVVVDPLNSMDEICETNNQIVKDVFIYEDEIRPVYPYQFSIINRQNILFQASTANPLGTQRKYYFEIDTTQKFNSALLRRDSTLNAGGSISFSSASMRFLDSTVYYWRVGMRPEETLPVLWNQSSFLFIPGDLTGFAQSHHFQHRQSIFTQIVLDTVNRVAKFDSILSKIEVRTGIYPYHTRSNIDISLNSARLEFFGCVLGSFKFYVFDEKTVNIWSNRSTSSGLGRFGSVPCGERKSFEFVYYDADYRKRAMDFMDSIPNGNIVVVTNYGGEQVRPYFDAAMLKADEQTLGAGKSLYHKFKEAGFSLIDSFQYNRPMVFIYRKGDKQFNVLQKMGNNTDSLVEVMEIPEYYVNGTIESPWFGPAQSWNRLQWGGTALENPSTDQTSIDILARDTLGVQTTVGRLRDRSDTSLNFINAARYPFLKLRMNNADATNATPHQLNYWRIHATHTPEGALAPNLKFEFKDTLELGEPLPFKIAFKNIGAAAFDSLKLKLIVTDKNNVPKELPLPRTKPLVVGDSVVIAHEVETKKLQGSNVLYLMVNPDNDQPEQFQFNNFIFKPFFVKDDRYQPWLDVTFDGVHILNRDIVSSHPEIVIKLKDDSRFLALSDSSLVKLTVRYPDGSLRSFAFGTDTLRFVPADLRSGENTATLYFNPAFTRDGTYELMVSGLDVNGNKAGELEYQVAFQVLNKPMISNLLNYPNPFTNSTAFVFTLTGSEVPQNMRIQIMTITGKVVREITKQELGPIRIGRNITEFKWDGTDQYGNKLANGIYLYRVLTNTNGKSLENYKAEGDNTDRFFNKGYGKMYLMR